MDEMNINKIIAIFMFTFLGIAMLLAGISATQPYESECSIATALEKSQLTTEHQPLIYFRMNDGEVQHAAVTETRYFEINIGDEITACETRGMILGNDGSTYIK